MTRAYGGQEQGLKNPLTLVEPQFPYSKINK